MAEIILKTGEVVLLDDADFPKINLYKWVCVRRGNRVAAARSTDTVYMHRLIMLAKDDQVVDHIDGNALNNQRSNLRLCTNTQNSQNRKISRNNKVGFKGVVWVEKIKAFRVRITADKRVIQLGDFKCPFKAARAYDAAAKIHHGEFANLNFP